MVAARLLAIGDDACRGITGSDASNSDVWSGEGPLSSLNNISSRVEPHLASRRLASRGLFMLGELRTDRAPSDLAREPEREALAHLRRSWPRQVASPSPAPGSASPRGFPPASEGRSGNNLDDKIAVTGRDLKTWASQFGG